MAPAAVRKNSFAAMMATAKVEAAKEALAVELTETRRTATLVAAGLANTYHLDAHRNDDLEEITDYGFEPLPSTTGIGAYHDIVLRDTKKALGVDKNGWAALQQDVKKFLERGGGAGEDDDEEVAKQFLESGDKIKMGNRHFGILPGAEAEGLLINEGGWCWGVEDEKLLPLVATIVAAAKAVTAPAASALRTASKKRVRVEELVPVPPTKRIRLPMKRYIKDEAVKPTAKPVTLDTPIFDRPVHNPSIALRAAAPTRLHLDCVLFNNGTRFGSAKQLNVAKCGTLHALFVQISKTYRVFFDQLHLSTLGICFVRLRVVQDFDITGLTLEEDRRRIDREGHHEWEHAVGVMMSIAERNGGAALDSLFLEVHFDALLDRGMMRYINETIIED
ncbi:MAG: hypothetical protein M1836_007914 [Candelina mexicana]|nr:MAG: hypothetical protein M1836_007914 [Candelina mexicana]